MNPLLLNRVAPALDTALRGREIGTPSFYHPITDIPVRGDDGTMHLVVIMESPGPFCFVTQDHPLEGVRAPKRLEQLAGATITGVAQHENDRVLRIDLALERDDGGGAQLFIHLHGGSARMILRAGDRVLESIGRRSGSEVSIDRHSVVDATADDFDAVDPGDEQPVQAQVPGLDPVLAAVFTDASGRIDGNGLATFRDAFVNGQPFRLAAAKKTGGVAPVPVTGDVPAAFVSDVFDDARVAVETVGARVLDEARQRIITQLLGEHRRRLKASKKLVINIERDIKNATGHEVLRHEAEALSAYRHRIEPGIDSVTLPDLREDGVEVTIDLDPALPIQQQIDKRFKKASKLVKSLAHSEERLEATRRDVATIESTIKSVGNAASFSLALHMLEGAAPGATKKRKRTTLQKPQAKGARRGQDERQLRTFDLDDEWFAVVGRSNVENDEVTFKISKPNDWWFHAQGVAGSHVVLRPRGKADTPPARIIELTASIAAHYSKSRHSGLVPVIYTLRKYVRKFRGAKPGQVKCEREKMVMVAPKLPE